MKSKLVSVSILMGVLGTVLMLNQGSNNENIFYNCIFVLIICALEIIKYLKDNKRTIITVFENLLIALFLYFGYIGVILLFPVVFFELVNKKISIFYNTLLLSSIIFIFLREKSILYIIFAIIINAYLSQIKNYENSINDLRSANKDVRKRTYNIEEKLVSFDKYLEQSNIVSGLKERNLVAQQVHDKLGHRITGAIMQLEVAKETLDINIDVSRKYLTDAITNLREGMDEIRVVLKHIKPKEKIIGIEDIKETILKFKFNTRIKTILNIKGDIEKLSLGEMVVIQENIKEALTNASRYSNADEVRINIFVFNKFARIEVRDNGLGCKVIKKSLGLIGMEKRLIDIGGNLECFNDNGFVVNMIINLGRES